MVNPNKITTKKLVELRMGERYLPYLNLRYKKEFRIDYDALLRRDDKEFPDLELFDLYSPADRLNIEVTKAPNSPDIEEHEGLETKFINRIREILRTSMLNGRPIRAQVSVAINRSKLKAHLESDLTLFKDKLPVLFSDSIVYKYRPTINLQGLGFHVIEELTIEEEKFGGLGYSYSEIATLDPLERVLLAYTNKSAKIEPNEKSRTILLIHIDSTIGNYYLEAVERHFSEVNIPFKEVVLLEAHDYGRQFFIFNKFA